MTTVEQFQKEEAMDRLNITQIALAEAMGAPLENVDDLCNNRRTITPTTALTLARALGNTPDFWLNTQRRTDLWQAMHDPKERERVERARPLAVA